MTRQRFLTLPKVASLICPACKKRCRRAVPSDSSPGYFDCDACGERTRTPLTACCIICAFTKTKCIPALRAEAFRKKLILRYSC